MGANNSINNSNNQINELKIPKNKIYNVSYCTGNNLLGNDKEFLEILNISSLIEYFNNSTNKKNEVLVLIYSSFLYKLRSIGYSLVPKITINNQIINSNLEDLIYLICKEGIYTEYDKLSDLKVIGSCYNVNINNIKYLLNKGNIIIAGIIIDKPLLVDLNYLNLSLFENNSSDIVLIVGYSYTELILKTNWSDELIFINIKFINNLKELWNIEVYSPEEKILSSLNK